MDGDPQGSRDRLPGVQEIVASASALPPLAGAPGRFLHHARPQRGSAYPGRGPEHPRPGLRRAQRSGARPWALNGRYQRIVAELQAQEPRLHSVTSPTGRTPGRPQPCLQASSYPVIVRVDAHTELEPHYTARAVETLRRTGAADVGGLMDAQGKTAFQRAVAAAYVSPLGLGGAAYHSGAPEGPAESAYLGVFRREALDAVGHFEETLWRGQDWDMCLRLRQAGYDVWFDPELKVTYWPRASLGKLVRQFYAAGIWRAELARRHREGKSRSALPAARCWWRVWPPALPALCSPQPGPPAALRPG